MTKKITIRITLVALFILGIVLISPAIKASERFPRPTGPVNDFAGVISPQYIKMIEDVSLAVMQKTGTAVVVATVTSIGDNSLEDYVNRMYQDWGIGTKGKDKGILIFLAVKERKIRIETGYGVEGLLPDGLVGRILDNQVIPHLRQNDYGKGLYSAVTALSSILTKEAGIYKDQGKHREVNKTAMDGSFIPFFIFILIIISLLFTKQGREILPWIIVALISSSGRGGGGFGSGGFGGFGGGFGGFGGGSSGGGGASRGF